jgi:glucose/mannose-6-phosphate isomerase
MKLHIANFPKYLQEGYDIGQELFLDISLDSFSQILFVGMGGSGMASSILKEVIERGPASMPCTVIKDYDIPGWVNEHTLMVVASYSGNTEETITAMKKGLAAGAHMLAVTS